MGRLCTLLSVLALCACQASTADPDVGVVSPTDIVVSGPDGDEAAPPDGGTVNADGGTALRGAADSVDAAEPADTAGPTVSDTSTAQDAAPSEGEETHSSADSTSLSGDTEDATGVPDVPAPSETACETSDDCATQDCWGVACVEGKCTYEPIPDECDDMNPCTFPDLCEQGACVSGPPVCAEVCDNGFDDDLDGLADCLDDDCLVSPTCWQLCHGQELLTCGQQIFDTTAKSTATNLTAGLCGFDGSGQEVIYRFVPPPDLLTATVSLDGPGHVALVQAGGLGACDGAECVDATQTGWTWAQDPTLESFFIVVDTAPGEGAPFALTVLCSFPLFESCSNGVDDDEDGDVDCVDSDCEDHPVCGAPIEDCANGVDDDLDGDIDCNDANCVESFDCSPSPGCDPLYDLPCGATLVDEVGGIGSTAFIDTWSCTPDALTGPETAHRIAFDLNTHVVLSIENPPPGARLLLVENAESCAANDCLASDTHSISFVAKGGTTYAVVIDAPAGVEGSYTLTMACTTPEVCDNAFDDDQDGLVDCEDDDCFAVQPCLGQVCQADETLSCEQTLGGVLAPIGTLAVSGCGPMGDAGEVVAVFTADVHTDVVFSVDGDGSPSLFVLDADGICDTGLCLAGNDTVVPTTVEEATSVYVVVDAAAGGAFQVYANCLGTEVSCWDDIDDDGDGSTDCADTDCLGAAGCAPSCPDLGTITCGSYPLATAEAAQTLIDGWGCPDAPTLDGPEVGWRLSLAGQTAPDVPVRVTLHDPADSGATLLAVSPGMTCDPMACIATEPDVLEMVLSPGESPYILVDRPDGAGEWGTVGVTVNCHGYENSCLDGADGDGDGLQDCADPDCLALVPPCEPVELACHNGVDDDGDQFVDCADSDCALATNCLVATPGCIQGGDIFCNTPVEVSTHDVAAKPGPLSFTCPTETIEAIHGSFGSFFMGQGEAVTVDLAEATKPSHVVVVTSPDGIECDPSACVASGPDAFAFEAKVGQIYLVLLVSTDNTPAMGTLTVGCESIEPNCFDGLDDDGDGSTDCEDAGCAVLDQCHACLPVPALPCDVTVATSDEPDWTTDVVDSGCGGDSPGPETTYRWTAEVDTDLSLTSSSEGTRFHVYAEADSPCLDSECIAGGASPVTFSGQKGNTYFISVDSASNDQPEAVFSILCDALDEACANGVDDDDDGLTDCEDAIDCKLYPQCPSQEICDDGVDNDNDGYSDCKDLGCIGIEVCVDQEECTDGVDNDGDGLTDCEDNLCVAAPTCVAAND